MIKEGLSKVVEEWSSDNTVEAKVLNTNLASICCFRKANFECDANLKNSLFSVWKKNLSNINTID